MIMLISKSLAKYESLAYHVYIVLKGLCTIYDLPAVAKNSNAGMIFTQMFQMKFRAIRWSIGETTEGDGYCPFIDLHVS